MTTQDKTIEEARLEMKEDAIELKKLIDKFYKKHEPFICMGRGIQYTHIASVNDYDPDKPIMTLWIHHRNKNGISSSHLSI